MSPPLIEPDDLGLGCDNTWRTALDWSALLGAVVSEEPQASATMREYFRSGVTLYLSRETKVQDVKTHVNRCLDSLVECVPLLGLRCVDNVLPVLRWIVQNEARNIIDVAVESAVSGGVQVSGSPDP